jgi:hypothetical protein
MIDIVVTGLLSYLFAGAVVWMLMDPTRFADYVTRWWISKHGELPTAAVQVCAVLIAIVLWPRIAVAAVKQVAR